ncbi:phosphate starvation-inducible protein PhoH [Legionella birminghamensis]|uniref:PhoH-like protein n=2 Tax=Legionella birminghamensis TaxID=28083 RepID=A0A378I8L5_9GAMM|nr:PhoH family protein [Legionella birminghamensis]KTC69295.1 phosphate starvation-inducible protein PhoH [Legionella birminghamensis]STX31557.1 phosphate starvation-inducible protein PhoH [Legionella birminghamensis]
MERLANLCGIYHENLSLIENTFSVSIKTRQDGFSLSGHSREAINQAGSIIINLYEMADEPISRDDVQSLLLIKESKKHMHHPIRLSRKTILPRNTKQAEYLSSIDTHDIIFAVGPAGTGKTYLAVSKAIESFEKGEVQRLVFVRPAVEAGEKLGFLPGDLVEKVLPYLRPVYDALYEMIGFKEAQKLIQSDVIEILPLAFMRGRTLNEAFIILDEAQNTTIMQMKMFLTRMGFGSKTVITGDMTQVDLPKNVDSGLIHAVKLFEKLDDISIHTFSSREVVRHPLVSKIVDCYERQQSEDDRQ